MSTHTHASAIASFAHRALSRVPAVADRDFPLTEDEKRVMAEALAVLQRYIYQAEKETPINWWETYIKHSSGEVTVFEALMLGEDEDGLTPDQELTKMEEDYEVYIDHAPLRVPADSHNHGMGVYRITGPFESVERLVIHLQGEHFDVERTVQA